MRPPRTWPRFALLRLWCIISTCLVHCEITHLLKVYVYICKHKPVRSYSLYTSNINPSLKIITGLLNTAVYASVEARKLQLCTMRLSGSPRAPKKMYRGCIRRAKSIVTVVQRNEDSASTSIAESWLRRIVSANWRKESSLPREAVVHTNTPAAPSGEASHSQIFFPNKLPFFLRRRTYFHMPDGWWQTRTCFLQTQTVVEVNVIWSIE